MKKVLHIIYDLSTAGAQTVVMNYMRYMHTDSECKLTLAVTNPFKDRPYERECIDNGFDVICCNYQPYLGLKLIRPIINWVRYQIIVWKIIKKEQPDIIHTHLTSHLPYFALPARFSGAKCVHTLHSDPYAIPKVGVFWAKFAFHILGFKAIAVTESQAKKASTRYGLKNISIVHNGLNLSLYKNNPILKQEIRKELGITSDAFVIGSVGRLDPIKNYPFLIKTFSEYLRLDPTAILLLVGDGTERKSLEVLAKELGIQKSVFFTGLRNDIQNIYKAMDVFMLTSFFESSSIVTVEAQLSGIRCVISSSIPDSVVISNNVNRISLDASKDMWLSAIAGDIPGDEIANSEENFSIKTTIKELKQVYKSLY